jgi:hypothetical protein
MVIRGGLQQIREFKALQREGRKRKRPSSLTARTISSVRLAPSASFH